MQKFIRELRLRHKFVTEELCGFFALCALKHKAVESHVGSSNYIALLSRQRPPLLGFDSAVVWLCILPHDAITLCCSGVAAKQRRHLGQAREHPYQRTGTLS